jgi:hypothetical protein
MRGNESTLTRNWRLRARLLLAVASYPARFKAGSREHAEPDLRCRLSWCAGHGGSAGDPQDQYWLRAT